MCDFVRSQYCQPTIDNTLINYPVDYASFTCIDVKIVKRDNKYYLSLTFHRFFKFIFSLFYFWWGVSPTEEWNHDRLIESQQSSKSSLTWCPGRVHDLGETGTPLSLGTWCEVGTSHSTRCVSAGQRSTLLCETVPHQKVAQKLSSLKIKCPLGGNDHQEIHCSRWYVHGVAW